MKETLNKNPINPEDVIFDAGDLCVLAKHTTCWHCGGAKDKTCKHRFDLYNLHGDCLANK